MLVVEEYDLKVPVFLMVGIYNGDTSGYSEEDEELCAKVIDQFNKWTPKGCCWILEVPNNDPYFTYNPDFTYRGCDVYDLKLTIFI